MESAKIFRPALSPAATTPLALQKGFVISLCRFSTPTRALEFGHSKYCTFDKMSSRPKRNVKPPVRYVPQELPEDDDDYSDELIDEETAKKKLRGEFDGFDDEEDEDSDEPNEYDVDDGFAVPDEAVVEEQPTPVEEDDEAPVEGGDDDDDDESSVSVEVYGESDGDDDDDDDDDEDDDEDDSRQAFPAKIFESDVAHN